MLAWAWVQHVNKLLKPGDVLSIPIQEGDPLPGILLLESRPSLCSSAGDAAQILGVMGQGAKSSSLKNIEKWRQKLGEQPLTLPIDLPSDSARTVLSKLLRDFLAERACEGHSGGLAHPSDEARCELLASLQGRGWAKQLENGTWQATRTCLQKMCATHVMHSPSAFGDIPADLPLSDMSSFQLCVRMQNMGWRWGKFRPAKTGPYVLGGPQYWHTSGKTVLREYLLSLLQAEQVLAVEDAEGGVSCIAAQSAITSCFCKGNMGRQCCVCKTRLSLSMPRLA